MLNWHFQHPTFFAGRLPAHVFFLPAAGTASGTGTCAGRFFQHMLFFYRVLPVTPQPIEGYPNKPPELGFTQSARSDLLSVFFQSVVSSMLAAQRNIMGYIYIYIIFIIYIYINIYIYVHIICKSA